MDTHAGDGGLHSFHDSVTGVTMFDGNSIAYEYDYLQRQSRKTVAGKLKETYAYAPGSGENTTTTRVSTKRNFWNGSLINQFQYSYDSLGNITSVCDAHTGKRVSYTYDDQGQLLTATHTDNDTVTRTEVYTYDNVGNILTFNNGTASHSYTYGDSDWKDLLTAVDGNAITYDASGNPTSYYNGYTMTWVEGRKLDTVNVNGQTYTYVYNADGQRVKKIHPDGSFIEYYVMDGVTVGESHFTATGNKTLGIRYTLDESSTVVGFTMNGANYYFAKNLQGDVLAVYNATTNAVVAQYTYDSWGNVLTATGSLAEINPFRYRSYYYDEETSFYYLQSRYYDAAIGRFINADALVSTGQGIVGYNMFAFCLNNPVNMRDYSGRKPGDLFETIDDAARDAALYIGGPSFENGWEYAASIYLIADCQVSTETHTHTFSLSWHKISFVYPSFNISLTVKYTYTDSYTVQDPWGVNIPLAPGGTMPHAVVHTHPMGSGKGITQFSSADKNTAIYYNIIIYVYGPNGEVRKYDPNEEYEDDKGELLDWKLPQSPKKPWLSLGR